MPVPKLFLPVIIAILLTIAFMPAVSADSRFSHLNTASGTGPLTAEKGSFPSFLPSAAAPSPSVFYNFNDPQSGFQPRPSIESRLPANFALADYLAHLPPPEPEIRVSQHRMSWDEIFTRPSSGGCGG